LIRIFHPYWVWEEYVAGMWRKTTKEEDKEYFKKAVEFTGNHKLYGFWMMEVADNWKNSCEHNLTDRSMNRQAWIGHAACCLGIGCPEHITRRAWWELTQKQQDDANLMADRAIKYWEDKHEKAIRNKCI
jgi:hypothetical protein